MTKMHGVNSVKAILLIHAPSLFLKPFLGAFAKLRNATITFVVSVCPSSSNNSVPTEHIFMKLDILRVFFESVSRKFKFG